VIIGVDVGATTLSGGLVQPDGRVLTSVERPTHQRGRGTGVEQLLDVVRHLQGEARRRKARIRGVGVGLPGIVDVDSGMMTGEGGNLVPEFAKVPIAERITEATGLRAFVDNDVNALALAEHRYGAGVGVRSLVVLALGTGPGGAIILNGELVRGRSGYGGELGHIPITLDGTPCICGGRGCLSTYVSGEYIAREARAQAREHPESRLAALAAGDPAAVTTRAVFEAARDGDAIARALVQRACEGLGAGLATVLNALNPDLVVITGGMTASLVPLEAEIMKQAAKYVFPRVLADTAIRFTTSSKRDTVRGGAALFLYEVERRRRRGQVTTGR